MTKNDVKKTLNEMKELTGYMKRLNEDYFMYDEMGGPEQEIQGPEGMQMPNGMGMQQQQQEVDPKAQEDAQKVDHANQVLQEEPIIGKIREVAIDGLKKYADQPTNPIYIFLKKTFLEVDKLLTGEGGKGK